MTLPLQVDQEDMKFYLKHKRWPDHVELQDDANRRSERGSASTCANAQVEKRPTRAAHTPGVMNKTEAAYARKLEGDRLAGEIQAWLFESFKLKLAPKTFYTCDFFVLLPSGAMEFHEVKGHWEDDARVKVKCAAEKFWMFTFVAVTKLRGEWSREEFRSTQPGIVPPT